MNLIAPVVFPKKTTALEVRAFKYDVEGKSLYDNPDSQLGELQMLVVANSIRTQLTASPSRVGFWTLITSGYFRDQGCPS